MSEAEKPYNIEDLFTVETYGHPRNILQTYEGHHVLSFVLTNNFKLIFGTSQHAEIENNLGLTQKDTVDGYFFKDTDTGKLRVRASDYITNLANFSDFPEEAKTREGIERIVKSKIRDSLSQLGVEEK